MANLNDYLEATAGTMGGEGELDLDDYRARLLQRVERDALLCLVDCRSSMFTRDQGNSHTTRPHLNRNHHRTDSQASAAVSFGSGASGASIAVKVEDASSSARPAREHERRSPSHASLTTGERGDALAGDRASVETAVAADNTTAFHTAMRCILKLFQEKIISSDKDLLALVLYNTAQKRNPYDFPGVFVLHPFNLLGADSVQEVEQLVAAGIPESAAYKQFAREAGHRADSAPSTLSDALWTAQHMFINVRSPAVKYRRIFVFTDDDEPTDGSAVEYRRCCARARDLYEAGVALEIFGLSRSGVKEEDCTSGRSGHQSSAPGTTSTATHTATSPVGGGVTASTPFSLFASLNVDRSRPFDAQDTLTYPTAYSPFGDGGMDTHAPLAPASASASAPVRFAKHRFWEPLLRDATAAAADATSLSTHSWNQDTSSTTPQHYAGAVYVNELLEVLDAVRRKVHPQRPFLSCPLQIGLRSDGGAVPRMAVSVYVPLMRAQPPKTEWLEGSTNALIKRRTRLVKRAADASQAECGAEDEEASVGGGAPASMTGTDTNATTPDTIRPEETCFTALVGGRNVFFTAAERAQVTEVAAAGADAGLYIVCFKAYADIIQHKHVIERSCFVHANLRQGGADSVRLFAQLVRSLRKKGRVAIALYRMRAHSKPKLVALIPSPDLSQTPAGAQTTAPCLQFSATSLAVEGLGFYMLSLPYADDLRPVPLLESTTSVSRRGPVKLEGDDAVRPADVQLARDVVRRLRVDYDITAVPNPTLQLIYQNLQDMALRDLAGGGICAGGQAAGPTEHPQRPFAVYENDDGADTVLTRARVEDYTRPDEEGMKRYITLFHDFNMRVLGPDYQADKYCPLPGQRVATTAGGGQRRQRAASGDNDNTDDTTHTTATTKGVKKELGTDVKVEKQDEDGDVDSIFAVVSLAAQRGAWYSLTVPQLRAYIKDRRGGSVTGKKKDELVAMAKSLFGS